GEKCELPPALVFGGDKDEWVPVELMRSFVADYNKAGGNAELQVYEGANHGFMTGKPDAPYATPALERMRQFIRTHTPGSGPCNRLVPRKPSARAGLRSARMSAASPTRRSPS